MVERGQYPSRWKGGSLETTLMREGVARAGCAAYHKRRRGRITGDPGGYDCHHEQPEHTPADPADNSGHRAWCFAPAAKRIGHGLAKGIEFLGQHRYAGVLYRTIYVAAWAAKTMVGSFNVHPETNALFSLMSPWQRVLLSELGCDLELAGHHPAARRSLPRPRCRERVRGTTSPTRKMRAENQGGNP